MILSTKPDTYVSDASVSSNSERISFYCLLLDSLLLTATFHVISSLLGLMKRLRGYKLVTPLSKIPK